MAAKKLDRFLLKDVLSDGSAGTVYLADELLPGDNRRTVALKVLPPVDTKAGTKSDRFFNEVKVLAQLAVHPHIVTIYAMGITDNYPWLAMEYTPNTLQSLLKDDPADLDTLFKVLQQIGRGLAAIHALTPPLVHQDLKPANVLLDPLNNFKITDFSLATAVAANRTHGIATVRYAAPEMLSSEFGKISPATDLYSLGHIAYELALGAKHHTRQFPAVFEGNASKEPPPNKWMMWHASMNTKLTPIHEILKEFPAGLSALIAKLMAKPTAERYTSADGMLADLNREQSALRAPIAPPIQPTPATPAPRPSAGPIPLAPLSPEPQPAAAPPTVPSVVNPQIPPPAAAPTPTTRYWVRLRGRVTGPYDLPTLQRQAKQGALSRLHQLSPDQLHWKAASEVEGLFGPTVV